MRNITVVSNRLPVSLRRDGSSRWCAAPSAGGLVNALEPVLSRQGGRWIGWPGVAADDCAPEVAREVLGQLDVGYELEPVPLGRDEIEGHYAGFANSVLWPLFHGLCRHCRFEPRFWEAHRRVNQRFARHVVGGMGPRDTVWIHDYHLISLGEMVRKERPQACLGFFLHIPFPRVDELGALPWRREIMEALLAYDVIGLQTARDLARFRRAVARMRGAEAVEERDGVLAIEVHGRDRLGRGRSAPRTVHAAAFPIGVDAGAWDRRARGQEATRRIAELRQRMGGCALMLGVDRLDYTKGVLERLSGYERLLELRPELRERVVLLQLVVPSREQVADYAELKGEIDRAVGRLAGRFAAPGWQPVCYLYGSVPAGELAAFYRMADVALVTPVCDGMNLVAKEYCAAQVDEIGALVLGRGAGAAEQLGDAGAFLVEPTDRDAMAEAMYGALTMDVRQRRTRMAAMRREVAEADVFDWADRYLAALEAAGAARGEADGRRADPVSALQAAPATALPIPILAATGDRRAAMRGGRLSAQGGGRPSAAPAAAGRGQSDSASSTARAT